MGTESKNTSVVLGQCGRGDDCGTMFTYYLVVSVIGAYISACGATPETIILLRAIFLGLVYGLYSLSYLLWFVLYTLLKRRFQENQADHVSEDEGKANLKEKEDTGSHKDRHHIVPKEEDLLERESGI